MQLRNNLDFFSPDEQTLKKKKKDRISKLPSFKINPQFLLQNAVEFW